MKIRKRQYEEDAVTNLRKEFRNSDRVLAVAPTGSGKTVIAAMLVGKVKRWRKVLWLAHRHELIDQAHATLTAMGLRAGVIMAQDEQLNGGDRSNPRARVQVASVQTIAARGVPDGVDLIVFDEAHRVMADSYQAIAESVGDAQILGLTATPCRMDGRGLGDFFESLLVMATPGDLHAKRYLAKPRTFSAGQETLSALAKGLKKSAGEFSHSSMAKTMDRSILIGKVVSESIRIAPGVPKVVFACGVPHSRRLVEGFKAAGVSAAHIDGNTPPAERERVLAALRSGAVEVVSNVDVLSEGWDLPSLGAVVLARPTNSLARYLQMVGRVQRYSGKVRPIVIDHGGNVQRFDVLPGEDIDWSLEGSDMRRDEQDPKLKECEHCCAVIPHGDTECPECGEEVAVHATPKQEREEVEAQLEEVTRAEMDALRGRIEDMARKKGAPNGWVEKVFAEMTS